MDRTLPSTPYVEKAFPREPPHHSNGVRLHRSDLLTYPYCTIDEIDWLPHKFRDSTVQKVTVRGEHYRVHQDL